MAHCRSLFLVGATFSYSPDCGGMEVGIFWGSLVTGRRSTFGGCSTRVSTRATKRMNHTCAPGRGGREERQKERGATATKTLRANQKGGFFLAWHKHTRGCQRADSQPSHSQCTHMIPSNYSSAQLALHVASVLHCLSATNSYGLRTRCVQESEWRGTCAGGQPPRRDMRARARMHACDVERELEQACDVATSIDHMHKINLRACLRPPALVAGN